MSKYHVRIGLRFHLLCTACLDLSVLVSEESSGRVTAHLFLTHFWGGWGWLRGEHSSKGSVWSTIRSELGEFAQVRLGGFWQFSLVDTVVDRKSDKKERCEELGLVWVVLEGPTTGSRTNGLVVH